MDFEPGVGFWSLGFGLYSASRLLLEVPEGLWRAGTPSSHVYIRINELQQIFWFLDFGLGVLGFGILLFGIWALDFAFCTLSFGFWASLRRPLDQPPYRLRSMLDV